MQCVVFRVISRKDFEYSVVMGRDECTREQEQSVILPVMGVPGLSAGFELSAQSTHLPSTSTILTHQVESVNAATSGEN